MTDKKAWFVAGTDTEIGKTFVTCTLLHVARRSGLRALGMKPVAAGADYSNGEWINEDAARLRSASSFDPGLNLLNPYCLRAPVAPHIAAAEEGVEIDAARIASALRTLQSKADVVVVEGVGGFRVPLGARFDSADLAVELDLPIILVVGMRLGCINHALLTAEAVAARRLTLAGWIANRIDPQMLRFEENVGALEARIDAPLLGVVPHVGDGAATSAAASVRLPD